MKRKYRVEEKEFATIDALRREFPHIACPPFPDPDLLGTLGISVVEIREPEPTTEELAAQERKAKLAAIEAEASRNILAGFDYEVHGEKLHFSYDSFDQQNFADQALRCRLAADRGESVAVIWKGYNGGVLTPLLLSGPEFLDLYENGALAHKSACLGAGERQKAEILGVDYPDEPIKAEIVVEPEIPALGEGEEPAPAEPEGEPEEATAEAAEETPAQGAETSGTPVEAETPEEVTAPEAENPAEDAEAPAEPAEDVVPETPAPEPETAPAPEAEPTMTVTVEPEAELAVEPEPGATLEIGPEAGAEVKESQDA